ncbi:MAG: exodeoxyribonuclease VII small subunit [Clostridia bacterium]|nr:exodeoxyribonuclease VII small subunit [Clostridia bacterium]
MNNEIKFEDAMKRLGEVVRVLENGEASLDESIALFEEGIKLSKRCTDLLEKAEQKVRFLQQEQAEISEDE